MRHQIPVRSRLAVLLLAAGVILPAGCGRQEAATNMTISTLEPISEQGLKKLSTKKIFFGHQSVGHDIVQGVGDVLKQYPGVGMRVERFTGNDVLAAPALAYTQVGRNSDPESKIRDFAARVRGGVGERADIAGFKFCYADVERDTDARKLFETYKAAMAELAREFPHTRFLHFTVPLKSTSLGWKAQVKKMLGRRHPFSADNVRRQEFNELMRREYAGRDSFFDLAAVEATDASGKPSFDTVDGMIVPSMASEYTYDTGHLNERGRKYVAERFLAVLASL